MARSSMLVVRVADEINSRTSEAMASMVLSGFNAARILFKRVVFDQASPLELKVAAADSIAQPTQDAGRGCSQDCGSSY